MVVRCDEYNVENGFLVMKNAKDEESESSCEKLMLSVKHIDIIAINEAKESKGKKE